MTVAASSGSVIRLPAVFVGLPLVGLAALAGCGTAEERPPPCPRVSILGEAASLTRFAAGRGQDLTDVEYEAEVTDVRANCEVVGDDGGLIVVALIPVITASRGPADADRAARFEYFVSVTDRDRTILNVVRFPVDVAFPGNQSRVTITENDPPVTVDIPNPDGRASRGDYQVFVGLQLTPDELEYNRRRQGGRR